MVDIRDGGVLRKSVWRISPETKPDVYTTSNKNSSVTFYTDLDSISFNESLMKSIDLLFY